MRRDNPHRERSKFIREQVASKMRPDKWGSRRGVILHKLATNFERRFDVKIGPTIDEMVKRAELIAVYRSYAIDEDLNAVTSTHIFASYPDPNHAGMYDPTIYLPDNLPRSLMRFADVAPNKAIKAAIEKRREQARQVAARD